MGASSVIGYLGEGVDIGVTTLTDIYTVPTTSGAYSPRVKLRSIVVTNRGAAGTFRLTYAPLGAVDAVGHYIAYDVPIGAGEVVNFNFDEDELTLVPTDKIRAYSSTGDMTFRLLGRIDTE